MKTIKIFGMLMLFSSSASSQSFDLVKNSADSVHKGSTDTLYGIASRNFTDPPPPAQKPFHDPTQYDAYGDLLNDNPTYNIKSDWPVPLYKVLVQNVELWAIDRYIFNYDFSHIGFNSWSNNLKRGFAWDDIDRFGIDFWGHPLTGGGYFIAGRSTGYSFYECLPLTVFGAVTWKYFGENDRPSWVDLINTSISGMLGGEILYRLGSNILDDRTTGLERVAREAVVLIMSPSRFTSRLFQGKLSRVVEDDVYQKEPLNTTLYAGGHVINTANNFGSGSMSEILGLQFEYGNPFEDRSRKPFDEFNLNMEINFGVGRKLLDRITANGILFGGNSGGGSSQVLFGGFQMFDYWDNLTIELGTIGLGPGVITKFALSNTTDLFTTIHMGLVPFAGNSGRNGPSDTSRFRDYNYCGGAEAELLTMLNFNNIVQVSVTANYYWMHAYFFHDNNYIGILMPKLTVNIFKDLGLGFEDIIYFDDRYSGGVHPPSDQHLVRTEQKFFVQYYFADARADRFD